jgi:predicted dehydrogenase
VKNHSPSPLRPHNTSALSPPPRNRIAAVPFVYRLHRLVREIRARVAAGEFGPWQLLHGSYLQDWLSPPPRNQLAGELRHWWPLTGLRRHRIPLVRSDGIRNRRTHRIPRCGNHHHVPERPAQSTATFGPGAATGPLKKVDTEDAAIVIFKTQSGVLGSVIVSQISAGRRNRLWFEFDGEHRSAVFNQENPETAWLGSQISAEILNRDPAHGSPAQRRLSKLPAGHPQGYAQCFENFIDDTYAAVRGEAREGLPTFDDGARSAHIIDAVLDSAKTGQWVTVTDPALLVASELA